MDEQTLKALAVKLSAWLGVRNLRYFRLLKFQHGTVSPVLRLNAERKHIPVHPVHLREGMQIRNFLRQQSECSDWDAHDFDNNWKRVVEEAIKETFSDSN